MKRKIGDDKGILPPCKKSTVGNNGKNDVENDVENNVYNGNDVGYDVENNVGNDNYNGNDDENDVENNVGNDDYNGNDDENDVENDVENDDENNDEYDVNTDSENSSVEYSSDEEISDDGYDNTSESWYKDQDLLKLLQLFLCVKSKTRDLKFCVKDKKLYAYIGESILHIIEYIANGAFGTVLKLSDANGTPINALKIGVPEEINKESRIIRQLHANGPLNGVIQCLNSCKYKEYALLELPYYPTDLHNFMKDNKKGLKPNDAKILIEQILKGLLGMHKAGVVHGDLKLKNILINPSNLDCVIIDLGNSFLVSNPSSARMCLDECTSPEMACGVGTPASDMWSLACILYKLVTGKYPYITISNIQDSLAEIKQKIRSLPKEHDIDNLIDFITNCILINPDSRMTAETALSHPYVQ
jgi:hypothetical protein